MLSNLPQPHSGLDLGHRTRVGDHISESSAFGSCCCDNRRNVLFLVNSVAVLQLQAAVHPPSC